MSRTYRDTPFHVRFERAAKKGRVHHDHTRDMPHALRRLRATLILPKGQVKVYNTFIEHVRALGDEVDYTEVGPVREPRGDIYREWADMPATKLWTTDDADLMEAWLITRLNKHPGLRKSMRVRIVESRYPKAWNITVNIFTYSENDSECGDGTRCYPVLGYDEWNYPWPNKGWTWHDEHYHRAKSEREAFRFEAWA